LSDLAALAAAVRRGEATADGSVVAARGMVLRVTLPGARVGARLVLRGGGLAEVVGFEGVEALALPLTPLDAVAAGTPVTVDHAEPRVPAGPAVLGRVIDALGRAVDGGEPIDATWPRTRPSPDPLRRRAVDAPLATGVRALDALCTLGRGQRIGLHAGPGAGKTTLLAQIARRAAVDVVVLALVGERGREVAEMLAQLPDRARTVTVLARADEPPLAWLRAAETATAIAEWFREDGRDVLLVVDSLTRVARAVRTVGVAAGEPATRRGFPPSLSTVLPALLERAANDARGTLTGVYSVLVEGDAMDDPVAEEARALLDGHVVLDTRVGRFPALAAGRSVSRCMDAIATPAHREAASRLRSWLAALESHADLISVGAYQKGARPDVDRALEKQAAIESFLRQRPDEEAPFESTISRLVALVR
jgi:type III secretion protein N (ATPase)